MGFADATAVTAVAEGRYEADVRPGWDVGGATNGGYLLALAARALLHATGRADPIVLTASYLSRVEPGPVAVDTSVLRAGRLTTARAGVTSAAGAHVEVLGSLGTLDDEADPAYVDGGPPDLAPPDRCLLLEPGEGMPPPLTGKVRTLLDPRDVGFGVGQPTGTAVVRGWFGLRDGEPLDTLAVLLAADAFPPPVFNAATSMAWVPTVQLQVQIRARPRGELLAGVFRTRFVGGGLLEEDGELWDEQGRLIALARQLALAPRERRTR